MTTIPNPVTVEHLKAKDACQEQVDLFAATFPDGMPLTEENLLIAARAELDLHWAAIHLLPAQASKVYDEALKAYDEALASALWSIIRGLPGVAQ